MNILIIGTNYEPDLGPSAPLYTMLCKGLVQTGHQVTVITMVPHYPSGIVQPEYRGKFVRHSLESGVDVYRIWLPSINRNHLGFRIVQFLVYQLGATIVSFGKKYDIVIAASSALSVWLPFYLCVSVRNKPAVYSVHDVYPDVGIKLGIFRNKLVVKLVSALERYCLLHADIVRILSESFRAGVRRLGVTDDKICLIYDWVDTELISPKLRNNPFSEEHQLSGKFVVLYAGNIGLSQGLEQILISAETLSGYTDIQFVFVGDGAGKESLVESVSQKELCNVTFVPFQSRNRLPDVLASADVSLVILRKGIGMASLPSKTYSIMASGRPIIASVDENSETSNLIRTAKAGLCIAPEDPDKMVEAILYLKQEESLRVQLGINGRKWAEEHHSPESATAQFEQVLFKALDLHKRNI